MLKTTKSKIILSITAIAISITLILFVFTPFRQKFNIADITSSQPYRSDWEVNSLDIDKTELLTDIFSQSFTYLGEGGQSIAFASSDQRYVIKFFKFNRFRPSPAFQLLPNIPPFSKAIQNHIFRRERKLETAFAGYTLAYDRHRENSGLLHLQLNPLPQPLFVKIQPKGCCTPENVNLQHVPFVIQIKGEMLGDRLKKFLKQGNLEGAKKILGQLFNLLSAECARGLYDLDSGIMHNIGCLKEKAFHLDVGKLTYNAHLDQKALLEKSAFKVERWLKIHSPAHVDLLSLHMQKLLSENHGHLPTDFRAERLECDNLFSSNLYAEYHRQLGNFFRQHPLLSAVKNSNGALDLQMRQAIALVEIPLEINPKVQRQTHEMFIGQLRAIAAELRKNEATSLENTHSRQLFNDLISWIYLNADLSQAVDLYFSNQMPFALPNPMPLDSLKTLQKAFQQKQRLVRNKTHKRLPEDHLYAGNIPLKITAAGTTLIRLAQPMIGNAYLPYWIAPPALSPEFFHFLRQQPSHLYINLMRRHSSEKPFSQALENLETIFPHVYVATLDKDSDFYWQKGDFYSPSMSSSLFKTNFINKLTELKGGFYWPQQLKIDEWKKQLLEIIENIHGHYFAHQSYLSTAERQDFIELTYCSILDALAGTLNPASMNITCRQSMDRGPSLIALWMLQKKQISADQVARMLLAAPWIIHQRTAHSSRIDRFISAAARSYSQLSLK